MIRDNNVRYYKYLYGIIIAPTIFVVPMASFLFLTSLMQCKSPQYYYVDISLCEILDPSLSRYLIVQGVL